MNFNDLKNGGNVLSAAQMKNVKGGGTCGFRSDSEIDGDKITHVECDLSKEQAQDFARRSGGHWCCDSCGGNGGKASYC